MTTKIKIIIPYTVALQLLCNVSVNTDHFTTVMPLYMYVEIRQEKTRHLMEEY